MQANIEISTGAVIQARRQTMGMRLADLATQMGGSPGESFLSRVEAGASTPSAQVAQKMADALHLQREAVLNAFGYATDEQRGVALDRLRELVNEPAPVVMSIRVVPADDPDRPEYKLGRRSRLVRRKADYFIVDLRGAPNEPFVGEVLVDTEREPVDGQGVVVRIDNELSAWEFHKAGTKTWIENGRKERRSAGYQTLGVIIRVTTERDLESA